MITIKKNIIIIIPSISITLLILLGSFYRFEYISESILAITALILLWYTYETSEIRKAESIIAKATMEGLQKSRRPVIGYCIFTNKEKAYDTRFRIENLSDYPVAVRLNCNFKLDGELINNFSLDYNGTKYWNLQYKEIKEGHFSWIDFYLIKGLITEEESKKIQAGNDKWIINQTLEYLMFEFNLADPPKLTIDLEIYCSNDQGLTIYYPSTHYDYDPYKMVWIPTVTSDKPYWVCNIKPSWIKNG